MNLAVELSDDFLFWPADGDELKARIDRILGRRIEAESAAAKLIQEHCEQQLVGRDRAFRRIVESLPRMAAVDLPGLITGETGTGKDPELVRL